MSLLTRPSSKDHQSHWRMGPMLQHDLIQKIMENGKFSSLPEELQELARLRCEFPEFSLRELGERLSPPISRSGVNHRLKKLLLVAEGMEEPKP